MTTWKHANSVWNEIRIDDVEIVPKTIMNPKLLIPEDQIVTPGGRNFYYVSAIFADDQRPPQDIPPVVIDDIDFHLAKSNMKGMKFAKRVEICASLTSFLKTFPNKNIYLRYFNASKRDENRRVFMAEVMEIIPILLAKQKTHAKKLAIRLEKYQRRWIDITKNCDTFPTLNFLELKTILESFDIDKSLITLVPDISYAGQVKYTLLVRGAYSSLSIYAPDGVETVPVAHGIFLLFQVFVMEVDWETEVKCREHGSACNLRNYRKAILKVLNEYHDIGERLHITKRKLVTDLGVLQMLCCYKLRENQPFTPGLDFLYCDFSDKISISFLISKIMKFELGCFTNPANFTEERLKRVLIPVWKARIVFIHLWAQKFFGDEYPELKGIVLRATGFKIPCLRWDEEDPIAFMLSEDVDLEKEVHYVSKKNVTDMLEYVLEVTSGYNRFTHPWFSNNAILKWYKDENIVRCSKWAFQDSTEEVRNGRLQPKRVNMETLIKEYKANAMEEFNSCARREEKMTQKANEILKQILLNVVDSESEEEEEAQVEKKLEEKVEEKVEKKLEEKVEKKLEEKMEEKMEEKVEVEEVKEEKEEHAPPEDPEPRIRESWEMAGENELINGIRQLCSGEIVHLKPGEKPPAFIGEWNKLCAQFEVQLQEKLEKRAAVLGKFDGHGKRGLNQSKSIRTLRKIVMDAPRKFAVHYYEFLETEQKLLMRRYKEELQKELDEAKRRCLSKERQIRSLKMQYSSKCDPSTSEYVD